MARSVPIAEILERSGSRWGNMHMSSVPSTFRREHDQLFSAVQRSPSSIVGMCLWAHAERDSQCQHWCKNIRTKNG